MKNLRSIDVLAVVLYFVVIGALLLSAIDATADEITEEEKAVLIDLSGKFGAVIGGVDAQIRGNAKQFAWTYRYSGDRYVCFSVIPDPPRVYFSTAVGVNKMQLRGNFVNSPDECWSWVGF